MPGGGPSCEEPLGRRGAMPLPLGMPLGGIPRAGCDIGMRGTGEGKAIDVGEPDGGGGPADGAVMSTFGLFRLATFTW